MKHLYRAIILSIVIPPIIIAGLVFGNIVGWGDVKAVGGLITDRGPIYLYQLVKASVAPFEQSTYGKKVIEGRGYSPWVIRSNLDLNTRVINFALKENFWASYFTESGTLYQVWQGGIDFDGAVYNGLHGPQPVTTGLAYLQNENEKKWFLEINGAIHPATVQYLGHVYSNKQKTAKMRYRLSVELAEMVYQLTLSEKPEVESKDKNSNLVRVFNIESQQAGESKLSAVLSLANRENTTSTGEFISGQKSTLLRLNASETTLKHIFSEPMIALGKPDERDEFKDPAERLMEASDCLSCHNPNEHILGPSWDAIAHRHKDDDKKIVTNTLAKKIIDGGAGNWGDVAMTTHPEMSLSDAKIIAKFILENQSDDYEEPNSDPRVTGARSFYEVEPRLETVHPNFDLQSIRPDEFKPKVGALDFLSKDRLLVATWDRDGTVFIVENFRGQPEDILIKRIAEGLQEALGIKVVNGRIFVLQKQEITELIDHDGDEIIDEYRVLNNSWGVTTNFHEFAFGLAEKDGYLYANLGVCVMPGGKSCNNQLWDRGHVIKVSIEDGTKENVAFGLRAPNGVGIGSDGEVFITDNQGDWLPSSKLMHVKQGDFYGSRAGKMKATENKTVKQPVVWMPQNEIGNSPSQPILLNIGPYRNQIIYGDVYHGGIKRVFVEKVAGEYQGALFRFSDGFSGAINRIVAQGNELFVGEIGSRGDWQDVGKDWFGLELLKYNGNITHEILQVRATPEGFHIIFTQPISEGVKVETSDFELGQWHYEPTFEYGGPKLGEQELKVASLSLADDRRSIFIKVPDLKEQNVVYININKRLVSNMNEKLWVNEAWYTLNKIPAIEKYKKYTPETLPEAVRQNQLSQEEKDQGWFLLFNGVDFDGWREYGEDSNEISKWVIEDSSLKIDTDRSDLTFFSAENLIYHKKTFTNFELRLDWKISKDGNSGILYGVDPEESSTYYKSALEMQVLDNDGHMDGKITTHRAGDLYDLKSALPERTKAVGQWNSVKIIVNGNHIEHWMNGERVLEIDRGSEEWKQAVADSKFSGDENYGMRASGYLLLQDHTDIVWYRNIKIKELN